MILWEVFVVCGIEFMVSFPISFGYVYISLVVDYVSKWEIKRNLEKMDIGSN